jgi:hypothetical protein
MSASQANAFRLLRRQVIPSLNVTVEEYEHSETGASHIHLAADNDENVFLVAVRTVPEDSTGVAHILEHTALCGSEKFPVRDPFFMMIRRSLNTFMNAMTSSDWTAYPFASQNKKDFNNLLDVYLDAVFFSRLDPLDFAQEGHRLEFEEPNNPDSALTYKGVVFNEMKGAMSSVPSQLWQTLGKYLYPTTTYHHNSGGEPECITDLTYEDLQAFYRSHYHPSNAIFMTYGDMDAATHQQKFQQQVLSRFEKLNKVISVPPEKRYHAPIRVEEAYPFTDSKDLTDRTHIVIGWLLGTTTDLEATLEAQLLASVLLDNSASPMQHALETTRLGKAPSPLCGLEDSQHELVFVCGVEGSEPEQAQAVEDLILHTLEKVKSEGIAQEDVEASLHQLELQQREIGGDGYPYGLQIILTALTAATHRGDPIALLDLDPALNSLREKIQDPHYIPNLINSLLLDNPHRVRLTLMPDALMASRKQAAEKQRLQAIKAKLNEEEKQKIIMQAQALQARQVREDDDSILPKVGLDDIPKRLKKIDGKVFKDANNITTNIYPVGTNGLVYQQAVLDLPELSQDELDVLPLYGMCLTELSVGNEGYLATQKRQAQIVGSINAFSTIRGGVDDQQQSHGHFVLSAKALHRNQVAMTNLMGDTLHNVKFIEKARIKELIAQSRVRREQSVTGSGHSLAMTAASASFSPVAQLSQRNSGLLGIKSIKALDKAIQDSANLDQLVQRLQTLHQRIRQQTLQFLLVTEAAVEQEQQQNLITLWQNYGELKVATIPAAPLALPAVNASTVHQAWITGTQVNFCAKAYPTVPMTHPDAPALTVLGGFLRNGYLHRTIREQGGAYGGGAQQDSNIGAFRFYSYRDPRLEETLNDFDKSIEWLLSAGHEFKAVEEAILGVVSSIDKPGSPAGEAKQTFHAELHGRTHAVREMFRNGVLAVTAKDLQRVGDQYLKAGKASVAIVTGKEKQQIINSLNLETMDL